MADVYTTGSWRPFPEAEERFVHAWEEFAGWASTLPGAGRAILGRDLRDPGRFVSFVAWSDLDAVRAWKSSPEFKRRMSQVQEHVDEFAPTELEVVGVVEAGGG